MEEKTFKLHQIDISILETNLQEVETERRGTTKKKNQKEKKVIENMKK